MMVFLDPLHLVLFKGEEAGQGLGRISHNKKNMSTNRRSKAE
jgi:hypothetical protein